MKRRLPKGKPEPKQTNLIVRSELNLEKNPVFTVSTYRERSREITDREGRIRITVGKMPDGSETGVLTTSHFKIYLALAEFWEQAGKPINEPVHFSIYKIIRRLDLVRSGRTYERVKRWLRELRAIPISFIHSFYESGTRKYVDLAQATILSYIHIYERKDDRTAEEERGHGAFQFDRHILQNLLYNYVHPLRLDVIKSFKKRRDLAILLYTFIDRNLAFKSRFEINLGNLFDNLDLSQEHVKYPSDRKRVIEPALEELKGKPLSTGILIYCGIAKTKDGSDYKLTCRKRANKKSGPPPDTLSDAREGVIRPSEKELGIRIPEEQEEQKKAEIEAYKRSLSSEKRTKLREKALKEIRNMEGVKEEFISDMLIQYQENEILRSEMEEGTRGR